MRRIDADALEELFREVIGHIAQESEINKDMEHMIRASAMVIQMIGDAPTVDAVPVVMCVDCKHRDDERCPDGLLWCNHFNQAMLDYQYCDYGERGNDDN